MFVFTPTLFLLGSRRESMAKEINFAPSDEEEGLPPPSPRDACPTVAPSGKDNKKKERREAMAPADAEAADHDAFSVIMGACLPDMGIANRARWLSTPEAR
jgi:hypothetical protein